MTRCGSSEERETLRVREKEEYFGRKLEGGKVVLGLAEHPRLLGKEGIGARRQNGKPKAVGYERPKECLWGGGWIEREGRKGSKGNNGTEQQERYLEFF